MTSRPPPRTNSTRSRPSVSTSRNSMSVGHQVKEAASGPWTLREVWPINQRWGNLAPPGVPSLTSHAVHCLPLYERIQFSSPSLFLGGPGIFSRTSRAS